MSYESTSPRKPSSPFAHQWETREIWGQGTNSSTTLDNADKEEAPPLVTQMRWMLTPSVPETPSAMKKNDA
jgi:hypothetical protein